MNNLMELQKGQTAENKNKSTFSLRHIGPREEDQVQMLKTLGLKSLEELISKTVPAKILLQKPLALEQPESETEVIASLRNIANKNQVYRSYIGLGFYNTYVPAVIQRNILENPAWYTHYTPYQAEISQGRLEALINFQTMVCDMTGLDIANASMLDEGTAAAEAMTMCYRVKGSDSKTKFFVTNTTHPHTIDCLQTRAAPLGIELVIGEFSSRNFTEEYFGGLVQCPDTNGLVFDFHNFTSDLHKCDALAVVVADILSLALLKTPKEQGADVAVGSTQRFGVPLGFGGPHAAYFAVKEELKREIPGRLIGVSVDKHGKKAYRLALQTREQHIKREKATSNICTAQVLLSVMASMYAVYHGPNGIMQIASDVHTKACLLAEKLKAAGLKVQNEAFFDTLKIQVSPEEAKKINSRAEQLKINLRNFADSSIGISIDETVSEKDLADLFAVFSGKELGEDSFRVCDSAVAKGGLESSKLKDFLRTSKYLEHPVFNTHRSETQMLRYLMKLQSKDLSLANSMIPLGSCTMKLNATTEMLAVSWPEFSQIHPFAPEAQTQGYKELCETLEKMLAEVTGFEAISLQPNAGSQGEYAGLMAIRGYHQSRGDNSRTVCLIPKSAHGTNPASAAMAGMTVVVVDCDSQGNIDLKDLERKAEENADKLSCVMVTYPSTHGVYEKGIVELCEIVHKFGGQVYMDGANFNAQVAVCRPGDFGVDVSHLNLHKTFCIPHGGGGPGVGPIGVKKHLAEFLPGHSLRKIPGAKSSGAVSWAPWGSASILVIPWTYIRMMGEAGLYKATAVSMLNANYVAERLKDYFPVLYKGENGFVAHECILDLRSLKKTIGIDVTDVAKRLMDYGFHAPTVSFPVVETMMVEPTESESKQELDYFCEAMIAIHGEVQEVASGKVKVEESVLRNAPHTVTEVTATEWNHVYPREQAAYPLQWLKTEERKFWPSVSRIDNAYGDRNLFCTCVPMSED